MLPTLLFACAQDLSTVKVNVVDGQRIERVRGAGIALVETHGEGDERETPRVGPATPTRWPLLTRQIRFH